MSLMPCCCLSWALTLASPAFIAVPLFFYGANHFYWAGVINHRKHCSEHARRILIIGFAFKYRCSYCKCVRRSRLRLLQMPQCAFPACSPTSHQAAKLSIDNSNHFLVVVWQGESTTLVITMSSSRSNKSAALAKLRMAKRKRDLGEDTTDELLEIREEEDVYDVVDESEYQSLVESRRQREDFVVDDGMCRKRLPFSCSFDCNLHRTARQW